MRLSVTGTFAVCMALVSVSSAAAQSGTDLYELGRRLKAVEAAWEESPDGAARKRAVAIIPQVHTQFHTLQFTEAARTLDNATHTLRSDSPPSTNSQWAASLCAIPECRVVDGSAKEVTVTVRPFYPIKGDIPLGLEIQLWFTDKHVVALKPTKFPCTVKMPIPPLGDSKGLDRKLYFMVEAGKTIRRYAIGISQIADVTSRVTALKKYAEKWPAPSTIEQATLNDRAGLLADLLGGTIWDTDLPAAALLTHAEAMETDKPFFTPDKPGQFWLAIPQGKKKPASVRLYVPRGLDSKKPVPLVVGLHGLGGTENLFFEGYGAGRAVKECEKRGWMFVATRSGFNFSSGPPVAAVIDELSKRYPIDPKQVFIVGHSMGAVQTIAAAQRHPEKFAAVAALGGGGIVNNVKAVAEVPVFIAAGDKDFGLEPARDLRKELTDGGAKNVTLREYPGIEHLLIVREALPDVFAFFDKAARR